METAYGSSPLDGSGTVSIGGDKARGGLKSEESLGQLRELEIFAAWCSYFVTS